MKRYTLENYTDFLGLKECSYKLDVTLLQDLGSNFLYKSNPPLVLPLSNYCDKEILWAYLDLIYACKTNKTRHLKLNFQAKQCG